MKISRRILWISLILGLLLLVGVLFPSFIQDNFVTPIALVLWLFWRILQSVDQKIYWAVLVFSVVTYFFTRLYRSIQEPPAVERTPLAGSNATLERINQWQLSIRLMTIETSTSSIRDDSLGKLLAALYASRQPEAVPYEIYDALKLRQIPLPESIYVFLFPDESASARSPFKRLLQAIRDAPRKRIRRWTGREEADYYLALEQLIDFMESVLEHKYADDKFDAHHD